ncbi:MAG: thioredoxin family protein [Burkholderiaceae bacterium]|nr:thioredoxin family protein [Burkholderiaceae bacterium]
MTLRIPDQTAPPAASKWLVACYCAAWCDVCTQYRDKFEALAQARPHMTFAWIDIEDHPDYLGDEDVENFPTLLVQHAARTLFFGPMLPHIGHLKRLLDTLTDDAAEVFAGVPDVAALLTAG